MKKFYRQRGMTFIGWAAVLLLIAFFATLALRLAPIYLESYQIGQVLDSFDQEAGLSLRSKNEVRSTLQKKLDINNIRFISTERKSDRDKWSIEKQDKKLTITFDYEVQQHMFFNIDVLVFFSHRYETVFQ